MRLRPIEKRYEVKLVFDTAIQLDNEQGIKFDELFCNMEKQKSNVKDCLVYLSDNSEIAIFKEGLDFKGQDIISFIIWLDKCAKILDIDLDNQKNPIIIDCLTHYNIDETSSIASQLSVLTQFVQQINGTRIMGIKYLDYLTEDDRYNSIIVELDIDPKYFIINTRIYTTFDKIDANVDLLHDYLKKNFEDKVFEEEKRR